MHMDGHGCAAVCSDAVVVDSHGSQTRPSALTDLYRANKSVLSQDLLGEIITNWAVPGPVLLVRRELLTGIGGYDIRLAQEDWDLFLRLAATGLLCFHDAQVAAYRVHERNLAWSADFRLRQLEDNRITLRKAHNRFRGRARALIQIQLLAASVDRGGFGPVPWLLQYTAHALRASSRVLAAATRPRRSGCVGPPGKG